MSICPVCSKRVTNRADQTRREGIRFHKKCSFSAYNARKARRKRDDRKKKEWALNPVAFATAHPSKPTSPFKRLYQILSERLGLSRLKEWRVAKTVKAVK